MTKTAEKITPNPLQQACIDNIEGKYLVLAGPGTGKTFTLIERIASMLKKNIAPEKILCLTFSDAAANEMKTRLAKKIEKLDAGVNIYTYHSFCNEIIADNFEDFTLSQNYKIIAQAQSRQFVKECIDELNPIEYRSSKNDPYVFLDTILRQIEEIKKNRLDKESYFKNIEQNPDWKPQIGLLEEKLEDYKLKNKKIPAYLPNSIEAAQKKVKKAYEIWKFYELYQNKMEANHYLDFNDMINLVLDKFQDEPAFLAKIANKFDYILVDEYQDTNKNQNDIIFNLTGALKTGNIFVVGDDDQIIYTFQGAKLDTIEKFLLKFPETKVLCLNENMRSTKSILNAARAIITQDLKRLEINPYFSQYNISKELIAKNKALKDTPVRLNRYFDTNQEYLDVVSEIEELVNSSECPVDKNGEKNLSEIAILTKSNQEALVFSQMLKDRAVPFELKEGKSIFEIKSSIVLYYYLKLLNNPELNSDAVFKLLLLEPFKIHPLDFIKLKEKESKNKSFIQTMREEEEFFDKEKIDNFLKTFDYLTTYQTNETLRDIVVEAGAKTGIFDYYLNSEINKTENIAGIKKLIDEAVDFSSNYKKITLSDFVEYLDIAHADDIPIKTDKAPVPLNAVQISTYHSSKGREFEYVYMPTLMKNYWEADNSSLRAIVPLDKSEFKTDEELKEMKFSDKIKLMYVGFTRAKRVLRLSYVDNIKGKAKNPSEFILKIQNIVSNNTFNEYDQNSYWQECKNSIVKRNYDYKKDFSAYINNLLNERYYSPSAINTYLNCKRQYLYDNILNLQSKYQISDNLNFGSVVHAALEKTVKYARNYGNYPPESFLIEEFQKALSNTPFSSIQKREILKTRGEKALETYYNQLITTPVDDIYLSEFKIKEKEGNYGFIGIIDRIDKNKDGTYSIFDYKTGSAKKITSVCPSGKHENYYNQLGLYKYFFEKQTNAKVKETVLIFPEDCANNLVVNYTEEECLQIVEKFKTAIDKINSCDFEPAQDKSACEFCPYKDFCNLEVI